MLLSVNYLNKETQDFQNFKKSSLSLKNLEALNLQNC